MHPLLTREYLRTVEASARSTSTGAPLMAQAAQAAARWMLSQPPPAGPVLFLIGPGDNGGDGWLTAWHLYRAGWWVQVLCATPQGPVSDPAQPARQQLLAAGNGICSDRWDPCLNPAWVVDALFGIGLTRPLQEPHLTWIERANQFQCRRIALDLPSGVDCDTGKAQMISFRAHHTLTFIADKPGLHTADGPDHCGRVVVFSLGLDPRSQGHLLQRAPLMAGWPRRARNTHKGMYGAVGVIGGARGMCGAALLTARSALFCGAGRVWLARPDAEDTLDMLYLQQPELMQSSAPALLENAALTTLVAGPGLGRSQAAQELMTGIVAFAGPLVLDADALHLLAEHPTLAQAVAARTHPTLLTPHPGEARHLWGESQEDRVQWALMLAQRFQSLVALKGCGTIVACPDGRWWINPTGSAALSGPGMGDVLAGVVGALLAQGLAPELALSLSVFLHGAAADACVEQAIGPVGLTAGELIRAIRCQINQHFLVPAYADAAFPDS